MPENPNLPSAPWCSPVPGILGIAAGTPVEVLTAGGDWVPGTTTTAAHGGDRFSHVHVAFDGLGESAWPEVVYDNGARVETVRTSPLRALAPREQLEAVVAAVRAVVDTVDPLDVMENPAVLVPAMQRIARALREADRG